MFRFPRRALLAAPSLLLASRARAQAFPERPVRVIVPYPPGGATDGVGRVVAEWCSAHHGKPYVVENRPGAGGTVGAEVVARSTPDGHTWLVGSPGNMAIAPFLYPGLPYVPERDLAPVSLLFTTDHVLVVHPNFPARTFAEFVAMARARARPLSFASSGNGSSLHLTGELFRLRTQADMVHVPYRGSAPALADLMGGNVDCMFDQLPASIGAIQAGRLRALATAGTTRNAALPGVPTVQEELPDFVSISWNGMAVAGGTPAPLVERISADIKLAFADAAVQARLAPFGAVYAGSTPAELGTLLRQEATRWGPVIREARISAT